MRVYGSHMDDRIMSIWGELFSVCWAVIGFSMIFRVRKELLPCTAAGSILSWFLYRAVFFFIEHVFFSCVTAAALTALYAEMMARWKKAPVTIFLIPSVLPLIPGSNLYYAVSAAVQDRTAEAIFQGSLTLQYTAAIALGSSLTGAFWMMNRKKS